jgi:replicative DNA helicase
MDLERVLVSKIVFTGQVEAAMSRNIAPEHFFDDECRDMYEYLVEFARRYKSTPSLDAVKHDRPHFEWLQTQETLEWVIDRFAIQVKRKAANDAIEELARAADDRERAENIDLEFLNVAQTLVTALPSGKVDRFSEVEKRVKEYEERKKLGKPLGIPYGIPTLDRATGGLHPWQLVTVLAFTNIGKSTLLRSLAFNFWQAGHTPLIFSLEMGAEEILHSFDAMAAKLDLNKLKQLRLADDHLEAWRNYAKTFQREGIADIPIIDSLYRITPDQVYAETLRHKPDCVIIDYVGLMKSNYINRGSSIKKHQILTDITQDLKINARMLKVPIIMAAQTNRSGKDGADLDNVADSISISQDSDVVIGMYQDEDMERDNEMEIRINKNRRGPRPKFRMVWDHESQDYREKSKQNLFLR